MQKIDVVMQLSESNKKKKNNIRNRVISTTRKSRVEKQIFYFLAKPGQKETIKQNKTKQIANCLCSNPHRKYISISSKAVPLNAWAVTTF